MREEEPQARLYYLREAKVQNWSVRQLQRQIQTQTYQRLLSTRNPSDPEVLPPAKPTIQDFIKDPYIGMFDDLKRGQDDNPTIGLILCADKDETIVQYSVLKGSEQLFASKYQTVLPSIEELTAELERECHLIEDRRKNLRKSAQSSDRTGGLV